MDDTDIFVSYGRADDEPFTGRLYDDLTSRGFRLWWDRRAMPSRGLTFTQEIRDAIDRANRLLLIVGPYAIQSQYVRSEWHHALLFSKSVVPALRLGTYESLPEELRQFHCPDCRDSRPYDEMLADLVRILSDPLPTLGAFRTDLPQLPPHFVGMRADLDALGSMVLPDVGHAVVVTAAQQITVIHGMGGVGKSVLASAFARTRRTRLAFADGIVWLSIGRGTDSGHALRQVAAAFGDDPARYSDPAVANANLSKLLEDKSCLIVLDDVWRVQDAQRFQRALGPRCRMLITARDNSLATALGAAAHDVGLVTDAQALELLAAWAAQPSETLPSEAHDVARACGGLPLALALCGARVHDGMTWADMRDALQEADLEFLDHPYGSVMKSLKVSVDALASADAALYAQLVVFPANVMVTEGAVLTLWGHSGGLTERRGRSLLAELWNKALIRVDGQAPRRRVALHDLQRDYLRRPPNDDLVSLNRTLVEAYARKAPKGWSSGPNDGYFFEHFAPHLVGAGRSAELLELLCASPDWMRAKSSALADPIAVADDVGVAWEAISPNTGPERASLFVALQAVRQVSSAASDRDDLEIEILVKLGRLNDAWRSVRGRADLVARFEGLLTMHTALRESGSTNPGVLQEMEEVARRMPDRAETAKALARLAAQMRGTNDQRSRALLDESLVLTVELENATRQLDAVEYLAPAMHDAGDGRVAAVLGRLEDSARAIDNGRERALALGRLGLLLASVGDQAGADTLTGEAHQLALRLTREGDFTLIADMGLYGIHLPDDPGDSADPDPLDRVVQEVSARAATGGDTTAMMAAEKERIRATADPMMRSMAQAQLSDLLVAAGMIDAAMDVATDMADDGFRLPALRRIVRAMLASGDRRAEGLFQNIEESASSTVPSEVERWNALGALAVAVRRDEPAWASKILENLWSKLQSEGEPDLLLVLSLAKSLARIGDRRFPELFDLVFRRGTLHDQGTAMVLEQFILRDLAEAILEVGFVPQARVAIERLRMPDQLAFALTALAGAFADRGDVAMAESLVPRIKFDDLAEAAAIRIRAVRARNGDAEAAAYFDGWSERALDLRRRFEREDALGALAHGLNALGRLEEAREVIDSITRPEIREACLVQLARVLTEAGRTGEALRLLPVQSVDRYVRTIADLSALLDRSATGQGIAALREVTRIAGWIRDDWKAMHEGQFRSQG